MRFIALLALGGLLAGCRPAAEPLNGAVFVLVMDGVRASESFGEGPSDAAGTSQPSEVMPHSWEALVPHAARATTALNLGATITAPAHAALVTGRRVAFGNYELEDQDPGVYRPELPSLMEVLRARRGLGRPAAAVVANTVLIKPVSHSLWPLDGYDHGADFELVTLPDSDEIGTSEDPEVLAAVKARVLRTQPRFVLANLHQADRDGHYGAPDAYAQGVRELDEAIAEFWGWIQEQPAYAGNTWLFVVADHGRHLDADSDPPWKSHGDSCWGCRHIPLLALGPGVRAGQTTDAPILLTDLAPTIAALLKIDLPWADGRVATELFVDPPVGYTRAGVAELAAAGGRVAEIRYVDRAEVRKQLRVDGERLSSPDALSVEGLSMASGEGRDWLCFRELVLERGETSPWVSRCLLDEGSGWQDIGGPEREVSPFWEATLLADGEALWAVYPHNPNAIASSGLSEEMVSTRAARWSEGRWVAASLGGDFGFPVGAAAALTDEGLSVAFGAAAGGVTARDERRIFAAPLITDSGRMAWGAVQELDTAGLFAEGERFRLESPALGLGADGRQRLAALAYTEGETRVLLAALEGERWVGEALLEAPGFVMPHLAPRWAGELVLYPIIQEGTHGASLCTGGVDAEVQCVEVGPQRLLDLELDGDTVHLLLDQGAGDWERSQRTLASLRR